jgi:hypothetical protein
MCSIKPFPLLVSWFALFWYRGRREEVGFRCVDMVHALHHQSRAVASCLPHACRNITVKRELWSEVVHLSIVTSSFTLTLNRKQKGCRRTRRSRTCFTNPPFICAYLSRALSSHPRCATSAPPLTVATSIDLFLQCMMVVMRSLNGVHIAAR